MKLIWRISSITDFDIKNYNISIAIKQNTVKAIISKASIDNITKAKSYTTLFVFDNFEIYEKNNKYVFVGYIPEIYDANTRTYTNNNVIKELRIIFNSELQITEENPLNYNYAYLLLTDDKIQICNVNMQQKNVEQQNIQKENKENSKIEKQQIKTENTNKQSNLLYDDL